MLTNTLLHLKNYVVVIILLLTFSCAQQVAPSGGPKDEKYPIFTDAKPANKSVKFPIEGQKINIKFQYGLDSSVRSTTYELRYYNPWMWDDQKSLSVGLWRKTGYDNYFLGQTRSLINQQRTVEKSLLECLSGRIAVLSIHSKPKVFLIWIQASNIIFAVMD